MNDERREASYRKSDTIWRVILFALGIVTTVTLAFQGIIVAIGTAVLGWTINQVQIAHEKIAAHEIRIITIENTRFTGEDGIRLWNKMQEIDRKIPSKIPPPWFEKEVMSMREDQKDMNNRLHMLEKEKND